MKIKNDVQVTGGGTAFHVTPISLRARECENVSLENWQWLGGWFGVDHRYIDNLVQGMRDDGLLVGGSP